MKARPRPDSPAPNLPREEWDFRAAGKWYDERRFGPFQFLPSEEVSVCHGYEFNRNQPRSSEILKAREAVVEWRDWQAMAPRWNSLPLNQQLELRRRTFDALLRHRLKSDPGVRSEYLAYAAFPEWPAHPYLSIPDSERRHRLKKCAERLDSRSLPMVRMEDLVHDLIAARTANHALRLRFWGWPNPMLAKDIWTFSDPFAEPGEPPTELVAFEVDFRWSDKVLLQRFATWLLRRRGEKGYKARGTTDLRIINNSNRADLTALGALRLCPGKSARSWAKNYSLRMTGDPLFKTNQAWDEAMDRASFALYVCSRP